MLLFLDFDGVLHGTHCSPEQLFCHVPNLEAVLREFPTVNVVISSTWRYYHSLEKLKQYFSPDIAMRIVGVTPFEYDNRFQNTLENNREAEILAYLDLHDNNQPWLALDDVLWQFPHHQDRVVSCLGIVGLNASVLTELYERLSQLTLIS